MGEEARGDRRMEGGAGRQGYWDLVVWQQAMGLVVAV